MKKFHFIFSGHLNYHFVKMNIEILSQKIQVNESYDFKFSDTVQRYMVGFSEFRIEYPNETDHHVQEITINLQNSISNGSVVKVTPELVLRDKHYHRQSDDSYIVVVVIAIVGTGNNDFCILNGIDTDAECQLPFDNITFLYSSLLFCKAYYPTSDHHVHKFYSSVSPSTINNRFKLHGKTRMNDVKKYASDGCTIGNIISYCGKSKNILSAPFDTKKSGEWLSLDLGDAPDDFDPDNYQIGCFISSFLLSFGRHKEHHVFLLKVGCKPNFIVVSKVDGKVHLDTRLYADIADRHYHGFESGIPTSELSGFFILIHKSKS